MPSNVILGAGIAGISAAYHLKQKGKSSVIFEKDSDWGGLCGFFEIDGFRFDRFVHFSFAPDENDKKLFSGETGMIEHIPFPSNYYHGTWLRHPAQNNLAPLSTREKVDIISDFISRPQKDVDKIQNYAEWLRVQYGDYFAKHFPFVYTRKYGVLKHKNLKQNGLAYACISQTSNKYWQVLMKRRKSVFILQKKCYIPKKVAFVVF